ncbi:hypothetical protein B0T19DRAFT_279102 [Cercophora scortea]|uniref:Uncharacterized protein n=1 Tax=Cercophora scortea TaxID=314031 RepID=A0AAE0I7N9_9PEZI|nr:hypothetical protein B0T19DRAFT_279102 [Cercophora scortea]
MNFVKLWIWPLSWLSCCSAPLSESWGGCGSATYQVVISTKREGTLFLQRLGRRTKPSLDARLSLTAGKREDGTKTVGLKDLPNDNPVVYKKRDPLLSSSAPLSTVPVPLPKHGHVGYSIRNNRRNHWKRAGSYYSKIFFLPKLHTKSSSSFPNVSRQPN